MTFSSLLAFNFRCRKNCQKKLNPSEEFSLVGEEHSKGNRKIHYQWSVQICNTSSDTCSDEPNLQNYSLVPDLTSETLVIRPDYFQGTYEFWL